jgi:ParB family chromosome partitioning protein
VRLLELPDQAQQLIDEGRLSAGHGRALLLCGDFARQHELAQRAAAQRWSVRELERAARRPTTERPAGVPGVHPDQAAVAAELEDGFTTALGRTARVQSQAAGTYTLIVDLGDTRAARHALSGGEGDDEDWEDPLGGW